MVFLKNLRLNPLSSEGPIDTGAEEELFRDVGRQAVGRDPRKPGVRVVGQEHGYHDHERGRDPDQHRVRGDRRCAAPAGHWPPPSR